MSTCALCSMELTKKKQEGIMTRKIVFHKTAYVALIICFSIVLYGSCSQEDTIHEFDATIIEADGHNVIIPGNPADGLKERDSYWYPDFLPEDYHLTSVTTADFESTLVFEDFINNRAIYLIEWPKGTGQTYRDEWIEKGDVEISGYKGTIYTDEESLYVIWQTKDNDIMLRITGEMSSEELSMIYSGMKQRK